MATKAIVFFTGESVDVILSRGGTASWHVNPRIVHQCAVAVCTRNSRSGWGDGTEPHASAFLVGIIKDVLPSTDHAGRYLITLSEYARVNIPDVWTGNRNPVAYTTLEDLGIDPSGIAWLPMPEPDEPTESTDKETPHNGAKRLTIAEAKDALSLTYGVAPGSIEIIIRG